MGELMNLKMFISSQIQNCEIVFPSLIKRNDNAKVQLTVNLVNEKLKAQLTVSLLNEKLKDLQADTI